MALILSRSATSLALAKRRSFALASLAMAALFAGAFIALLKHDAQLLKTLIAFAPLFKLVLLVLAVANLFLGILYFFSWRSAALAAVVLSLLLAFPLSDFFVAFTPVSILSPRYLAYQIQAEAVPIAVLRVSKIRRSTLFGLNFYLRTDLQEWDRDPSREVYLLATGSLTCSKIPEEITCSDLWGEIDTAASFKLLHLTPKR